MAKIIAQRVESGAQKLLSSLGISVEHFAPGIIAEIPVKATGLLAGIDARVEVGWDKYGNPYPVIDNARVSLAAAITHQDTVFVYNRDGKSTQNDNNKLDVLGAVGFGVSSLLYKIPTELILKPVESIRFSDLTAIEETDGQGDWKTVKMPIVVIEVADIDGCEQHFVNVPQLDEASQTAKLQAAVRAITEKV